MWPAIAAAGKLAGDIGLFMIADMALKGLGKKAAQIAGKRTAAAVASTTKSEAARLAKSQVESMLGKSIKGDLAPWILSQAKNMKMDVPRWLEYYSKKTNTPIEVILAKHGSPIVEGGLAGKIGKALGGSATTAGAMAAADAVADKYKGPSSVDNVVLGGLFPLAAKIAQAAGISVDAAMTMLGDYADKYKETMLPADKERIYGATPSSIAAATVGPAAKTIGTIANATGNAIGSSVDNYARMALTNKMTQGVGNLSTGVADLINGRERRSADAMKEFAKGSLTDIPTVPKRSDERLKNIVDDFKNNKGIKSLDDFLYLAAASGYKGADILNDEKDYEDSVLDGYADHIRNYAYQYNDKAKDIDPSIDTSTEHIGPMAQDVKKVIPSAVIQDESGYLKVDTARLALANAGAIGDLARENREMKQEINELKEGA